MSGEQMIQQGCLTVFRLIPGIFPHAAALPALLVFRSGWGVHYATRPRLILGMIVFVIITTLSPTILG